MGEAAELLSMDVVTALADARRLTGEGAFETAIPLIETLLQQSPSSADLWHELGSTYLKWRKHESAEAGLRQALHLAPKDPRVMCNLGVVFLETDRLEAARDLFLAALRIDRSDARSWVNLSETLRRLADHAGSQRAAEVSIKLDPSNADSKLNAAHSFLIQEKWREGWALYEARRTVRHLPPAERWDGTTDRSLRLRIQAEQGLGDTIQFARFIRDARRRVGHVTFACHDALLPLLRDLEGVDSFIPIDTRLSGPDTCDRWIPMMSLPHSLGIERPAQCMPYLRASEPSRHSEVLEAATGRRIGLAWQGSRRYPLDHERSMPFRSFAPILRLAECTYFSLQAKDGAEQTEDVDAASRPFGFDSTLDAEYAFRDTCAILSKLDLLICTDSAIAHVAGAMGVPTWLLLPFVPDWRWGTSGEKTVWYPNTRIFRQRSRGDWEGVIREVGRRLEAGGSLIW